MSTATALPFHIKCLLVSFPLLLRSTIASRIALFSRPPFSASSPFSSPSSTSSRLFATPSNEGEIATQRDATWMMDANSVEYFDGPQSLSFQSLGALGINVSSDISSRNVVPYHIVGGNDLFCNRELNMDQIETIGFDMDWTLAQYNREFDLLAFNGAKEKLVSWLGYPEEVRYPRSLLPRNCHNLTRIFTPGAGP